MRNVLPDTPATNLTTAFPAELDAALAQAEAVIAAEVDAVESRVEARRG